MEDLNNRQIVLLTMFTSFVVSIATGIITVAMLEEAPPTLTQTVNRVVEHTIERVVSGSSTPQIIQAPATVTNVTKEVTVYAKEDDLVVSAVEKNQPRVAKIYLDGMPMTGDPQSIGFVISRDGLIATPARTLLGVSGAQENYTVVLADRHYAARLTPSQDETKQPVYFLKITNLDASTTLDAVTFGRNDNLKLAQSAVVLGGSDGSAVFKTTLSKLRMSKEESTSTPSQLVGIETSPRISADNTGGLVVNLDAQVIGMALLDPLDISRAIVYPIARILDLISATSGNQVGTGSALPDARIGA